MKWAECPVLLPGDVVLSRPRKKNWFSSCILALQRLWSEPRSEVTHAFRMLSSARFVEAVAPRVGYGDLREKYATGKYDVAIFRRIDLTLDDWAALAEEARKHAGARYAWLLLGVQAIDAGLSWLWHFISRRNDEVFATRWLAWKVTGECWEHIAMYCSWEVAESYDDIEKGYTSKPWWAIQPDDIWDESIASLDWRCVFWTDGFNFGR